MMLGAVLSSCTPSKVQGNILGEWNLQSRAMQTNYPSIVFRNDSSVAFTSRADTVFHFRYHVNGQSLNLVDIDGKKSVFKIIELSDSLLIFESLLEHSDEQVYKRQISKRLSK
jgi:hypothetical protein